MQGETDWVVHDFDSDGSTTETTITELASNTSYDAQVRAVNAEGSGPWSPTSIAKTAEARLTVAFSAETFTVDEGDTADITVNVDPTADRNVTVTVEITHGTGATLLGLTDGMLTIVRGQNSASFTISGDQDDDDAMNDKVTLTLSKDEYTYNVVLGNPSTVTILDDEVPNFPPAFATTTVNRIIPEDSTVGAVIGEPVPATDPEGDSLTYSLSGEGSEHFDVNDQGQISLSVTLNYEDNTPTYSLTLSVRDNKDDVGNPDSETDACVTVNVTVGDVDEPPGSVDPVIVTSLSSSELHLRWSRASNTGPRLEYQVHYREQGKSDWTDLDFGDDAYETTIPNLDTNTTYQVRVRGKNDEGEGEWASGSGTTERAELTVAFSSATHTVDEGSNTDITVNVDPDADRDVTVTITMTGTGAALSGLTDGMLTIVRGQNSSSFTISGDQDNDAEDGSVTLALTTDDDKVILGSPSTATVTIVDTEEPNNPPVRHNHLADHHPGEPDSSHHSGSYGPQRRSHHRMVHDWRIGQVAIQSDQWRRAVIQRCP